MRLSERVEGTTRCCQIAWPFKDLLIQQLANKRKYSSYLLNRLLHCSQQGTVIRFEGEVGEKDFSAEHDHWLYQVASGISNRSKLLSIS